MTQLTVQSIQGKIVTLPNRPPFMLTRDLAEIYETDRKQISQAVLRNPERFPEDFCFDLTADEIACLQNEDIISDQHVSGKQRAFTRMGANMLSAILKSKVAAQRCVQIMRAFSAMECGYGPNSPITGPITLAEFERRQAALQQAQEELYKASIVITGEDRRLLGITHERMEEIRQRDKIRRAVDVIIQMEAEGRPRDEIARVTGKTRTHIRVVIHQARQEGLLPPLQPADEGGAK